MGEIGYKGFNANFTCRGKQYEENKVFEEDKAVVCADVISKNLEIKLDVNDILIAEVSTEDYMVRNWYREGTPQLARTDAVKYQETDDGVEIQSECYVHIVEIEGVEAPSDNYFSLLPGEKRKILFKKCSGRTPEVNTYTFV